MLVLECGQWCSLPMDRLTLCVPQEEEEEHVNEERSTSPATCRTVCVIVGPVFFSFHIASTGGLLAYVNRCFIEVNQVVYFSYTLFCLLFFFQCGNF